MPSMENIRENLLSFSNLLLILRLGFLLFAGYDYLYKLLAYLK